MRPWELKDKGGLDRYTGMTIAAKTPKLEVGTQVQGQKGKG